MNKRQEEILTCVVDHFIDSNQPMSSKMILEKSSIQLSSASVRQVFSVLDQQGYLEKRHTSSGRVPTDKGYRVYVDNIKGKTSSIRLDDVVTDQSYQMKFRYFFDQLLSKIVKKIPYISMIMLNNQALAGVASLKYVSISSHYGLVLMFHNVGIVSEHYIRFETDISDCDSEALISWLQNELNYQRYRIDIQAVFSGKDFHFLDAITASIFSASTQYEQSLLIKNVTQCLSLADYEEKSQVQDLLSVVDDHDGLSRLMKLGLDTNRLNVFIGQELQDPRLLQSSLISIPICLDGLHVACLGILGPTRMDYNSIIQLLSSSETLAELI